MRILIGLPVYKRAWILPHWFKAIEQQSVPLSDLGFIFELGEDDDETHQLLWDWHAKHPEVEVFDGLIRDDQYHDIHPENGRRWTRAKYMRMVMFRNSLLDRAQCYAPEAYFSLDSDILLESPDTLQVLFDLVQKLDIVSPLSYMKPGTNAYPSVMTWMDAVGGIANRDLNSYPIGQLFKADIVMAAVMMSPKAYSNARYFLHPQGEDLSLAASATVLGMQSWCVSYLYGAHIMQQSLLEPYLLHGDERSTTIGSNKVNLAV